ncbi:MAG: hypothetical protein EBU98_07290, partial [Actinobacteria bacterium]|nr:hypothetical protein [Actinomycetota bacterium]
MSGGHVGGRRADEAAAGKVFEMTNESGDTTSPQVELPDPPREGKATIPPPPGRAFRAPGAERDG